MKPILKQHRFLLLLCFLILFNIALSIQLYFLKLEEKKKVVEVVGFGDMRQERKIIEEDAPYQLRIYYPITSYPTFNQEIDVFVQKQIQEFKKETATIGVSLDQTYSLDILYQEYSYQTYLTYVFTIFQDFGGAHPYSFYQSLSYNTDTNEMVTIDHLIEENASFLEIVSTNVREKLSKNVRIVSYDLMIQGTLPERKNYSTFALTKEGYLFFFSPYQVAPYSSGKFQVLVPYSLFLEKKQKS